MKSITRIFEYLDFKGIKHTRAEKEWGLSNGYLNTQLKRDADLGERIIRIVIENCPDMSLEWLVLGVGSMLESTKRSKIYRNSFLAANLVFFREGTGLTQSVFSRLLSIEEHQLIIFERGVIPDDTVLSRIAQAFSLSVNELLKVNLADVFVLKKNKNATFSLLPRPKQLSNVPGLNDLMAAREEEADKETQERIKQGNPTELDLLNQTISDIENRNITFPISIEEKTKLKPVIIPVSISKHIGSLPDFMTDEQSFDTFLKFGLFDQSEFIERFNGVNQNYNGSYGYVNMLIRESSLFRGATLFGIKIGNDQMSPSLWSDDVLIIEESSLNSLKEANIYVVITSRGNSVIGRLYKRKQEEGTIACFFDNVNYSPIYIKGSEIERIFEAKGKIGFRLPEGMQTP